MDYRALFKFRASVDWLAFEIETASREHGDKIFKCPFEIEGVRKPFHLVNYVTPLNKGPGGVATRFLVCFQDVTSWDNAQAKLDALAKRFPLASEPTVAGIEVSFDAFARTATRADLIDMAVHFFAFGNVVADYRSSGVWLNGAMVEKVAAVMSRRDVRRLLGNDRVINIGNVGDDVTQRVYFKTKDNGKPLPEEEHRARAEVTLQGAALPFTTLVGARSFKFQTMTKPKTRYFGYRKQKDGMEPLPALIHTCRAQVGKRAERRTENRSKLLYDPNTQADTALNERARKAFSRLTEQMQLPLKVGGNSDFF